MLPAFVTAPDPRAVKVFPPIVSTEGIFVGMRGMDGWMDDPGRRERESVENSVIQRRVLIFDLPAKLAQNQKRGLGILPKY